MATLENLAGRRFARLTVVQLAERQRSGTYWLCRCDCGNEKPVKASHLKAARIVSCGCLRSETLSARRLKHGRSETSEYATWLQMRARCHRPTADVYKYYGGRGIRVCDRWRRSFEAFLADMGPRPTTRHRIERLDNDGHYEPGNCKWATQTEQGRNKRNNHKLTYQGLTLTVSQWSERTGLSRNAIESRVDRFGWTAERALTTPSRQCQVRSPRPRHLRASR